MDDRVRAIEDNAAELLMAMGTAGGGSQRDDGGLGFREYCAIDLYEWAPTG